MLLAKSLYHIKVKRISESMGDHNRLGLLGISFFEHTCIDIVSGNRYINENRYGTVLNDRSYGCRKSCRNRNDLISAFHPSVSEKR